MATNHSIAPSIELDSVQRLPSHLQQVRVLQEVPYMSIWTVEKQFNFSDWRLWFEHNWQLSVYMVIIYLVTVFGMRAWMSRRDRLTLRFPLFVWNVSLAVFSILGTLRTLPELYYILTQSPVTGGSGWWGSVCSWQQHNQGTAFWALLFTISKAVELGDTLFIVLRKQKLIFLHWYHHTSVLFITWYIYSAYNSTTRWYGVINFAVHSLMYTYYALKALSIKIPRPVGIFITSCQLGQMVLGLAVNFFALHYKTTMWGCAIEPKQIVLVLAMYVSYLLLFGHFFWSAYCRGSKKSPVVSKDRFHSEERCETSEQEIINVKSP